MAADEAGAVCADGALGVPEATAFVGLSKTELYKLMDAGTLVFVRYGRKRLIPRRALTEFLEARLVTSPARANNSR